jgi:hypothetical protein
LDQNRLPSIAALLQNNDIILPAALRSSAAKSFYFASAWQSLQPQGGDSFSYKWLPELVGVHAGDTAIHAAFAAVSLIRAGQLVNNEALRRQGDLAYMRALSKTQRLLEQPCTANSKETLGCILTLVLFEVIAKEQCRV